MIHPNYEFYQDYGSWFYLQTVFSFDFSTMKSRPTKKYETLDITWESTNNILNRLVNAKEEGRLVLQLKFIFNVSSQEFNPISPKSDQHQISPCDINAL